MALRRQVRLRKEYIYRKSLQGKEAAVYEDKQRVREALRDGKPLPTELRADEGILRHQVRYTCCRSCAHMNRMLFSTMRKKLTVANGGRWLYMLICPMPLVSWWLLGRPVLIG